MNPIKFQTKWRPDGKPVITVYMIGSGKPPVEIFTQDLEDLIEETQKALRDSKDLKF